MLGMGVVARARRGCDVIGGGSDLPWKRAVRAKTAFIVVMLKRGREFAPKASYRKCVGNVGSTGLEALDGRR